MILGVYRKTEASSQKLLLISPKSPEHGYLVNFMFLKLLELSLEAQVGVGTRPPCTHSVQGILPAKVGDGHDVCDHQSHTPGDASQAARAKRTHRGKGFQSMSLSPDSLRAGDSVDLILESLPAVDYEWTASQYEITQKHRSFSLLYCTRISGISICVSLFFFFFNRFSIGCGFGHQFYDSLCS